MYKELQVKKLPVIFCAFGCEYWFLRQQSYYGIPNIKITFRNNKDYFGIKRLWV